MLSLLANYANGGIEILEFVLGLLWLTLGSGRGRL